MFAMRAIRWPLAAAVLLAASAAAWAEGGGKEPEVIDPSRYYNAIWAIGIFLVLIAILGRKVWKPAMQAILEREKFIADQLAKAEQQRKESQSLLERYEAKLADVESQAVARLQQASAKAEEARQEILAAARTQAADIARNAEAEIGAARQAAVREITVLGAELATSVARTILRKEMTPEDHRRIVGQAVEEIRFRGTKGATGSTGSSN
jgi:F-type H+-transporting ATPase subunit b